MCHHFVLNHYIDVSGEASGERMIQAGFICWYHQATKAARCGGRPSKKRRFLCPLNWTVSLCFNDDLCLLFLFSSFSSSYCFFVFFIILFCFFFLPVPVPVLVPVLVAVLILLFSSFLHSHCTGGRKVASGVGHARRVQDGPALARLNRSSTLLSAKDCPSRHGPWKRRT